MSAHFVGGAATVAPEARAFLEDADEEGVTWEAKADDDRGRLRPDSIQKAACGLASQIGGYVIVGARRDKTTGECGCIDGG